MLWGFFSELGQETQVVNSTWACDGSGLERGAWSCMPALCYLNYPALRRRPSPKRSLLVFAGNEGTHQRHETHASSDLNATAMRWGEFVTSELFGVCGLYPTLPDFLSDIPPKNAGLWPFEFTVLISKSWSCHRVAICQPPPPGGSVSQQHVTM